MHIRSADFLPCFKMSLHYLEKHEHCLDVNTLLTNHCHQVLWMNEWIWFKWRYHRTVAGALSKIKFQDGLECQRGNDAVNRWVFRCRQKDACSDEWLRGPNTGLQGIPGTCSGHRVAWSPRVDWQVDGTTSVDVLVDLNRRRASTFVTFVLSSRIAILQWFQNWNEKQA